ncbi:hypothetical protein ACLOJK_000207, partial [Asimina triloba]
RSIASDFISSIRGYSPFAAIQTWREIGERHPSCLGRAAGMTSLPDEMTPVRSCQTHLVAVGERRPRRSGRSASSSIDQGSSSSPHRAASSSCDLPRPCIDRERVSDVLPRASSSPT